METRSKRKISDEEYRELLKRPHKSWVFTLNNYKEEDIPVIAAWEDVARMTVGKEVGKKTGTPHLQGAVTFTSAKRFSGVKKLNEKISWRVMAAKWNEGEAAFEYCRKDDDVVIEINNSKQGKRSDIEIAYDLAESGTDVDEVRKSRLGYQALRVWEKARTLHAAKTREVKVYWLHGKPGTGKTRLAVERGAKLITYEKGFWQGYEGEKII